MPEQPIVQVRGLRKLFPVRHSGGVSMLQALNGVDFEIARGETLGLVGESGSGKTTVGRILVGLIPATEGSVSLFGRDITGRDGKAALATVRSRLQFVFQDPYAALNPRMRIGPAIAEPLDIAGTWSRTATTASPSCSNWSDCRAAASSAFRTNSPADSASAS